MTFNQLFLKYHLPEDAGGRLSEADLKVSSCYYWAVVFAKVYKGELGSWINCHNLNLDFNLGHAFVEKDNLYFDFNHSEGVKDASLLFNEQKVPKNFRLERCQSLDTFASLWGLEKSSLKRYKRVGDKILRHLSKT